MAVNGIGNGYFYPVKNQETVGMKASDSKPNIIRMISIVIFLSSHFLVVSCI